MDNNNVDSVLRAVYVGVVVMPVGNGMGGFRTVCALPQNRGDEWFLIALACALVICFYLEGYLDCFIVPNR